jgi:hypothetical protein
MWSSQRGLKAQVLGDADGGVGCEREARTVRPSIASLAIPERSTSASIARPMNQCAPCVE